MSGDQAMSQTPLLFRVLYLACSSGQTSTTP